MQSGDFATAQKEVHTLKGVALNLGILPLADPCIEMLMLFREDAADEAVQLMPQINHEFSVWADFSKNCPEGI